jgi:hypothetical protein
LNENRNSRPSAHGGRPSWKLINLLRVPRTDALINSNSLGTLEFPLSSPQRRFFVFITLLDNICDRGRYCCRHKPPYREQINIVPGSGSHGSTRGEHDSFRSRISRLCPARRNMTGLSTMRQSIVRMVTVRKLESSYDVAKNVDRRSRRSGVIFSKPLDVLQGSTWYTKFFKRVT